MDKTDNVHIIFDESAIKDRINTIAKVTGKINGLPPELADSGCKEALVKTLVDYKTTQITEWINRACQSAFASPTPEFKARDSTVLLDPLSEDEADYADFATLIDPLLDEEGKYRAPHKDEEVAVSVKRDGQTIYYKWAGASVLQISSVDLGHIVVGTSLDENFVDTRLDKNSLPYIERKQKAQSKGITPAGKKREPPGSCKDSPNKENPWTEDDKAVLAEELNEMLPDKPAAKEKKTTKKRKTKKQPRRSKRNDNR